MPNSDDIDVDELDEETLAAIDEADEQIERVSAVTHEIFA